MHTMSRLVNRDFILGDQEKEYFRGLMRRLAGFCGLEILRCRVRYFTDGVAIGSRGYVQEFF